MNNIGFIKLPRKIREWIWYGKLNTRAVFLHILLGAAWEDEIVHGITIRRGQFVTTVPELAAENQLTIQQVKTALSHLKSTGDITVSVQSKISVITVNNYNNLLNGSFKNNEISTDTSNGYQAEVEQDSKPPTLLLKNTRIEEAEETRAAAAENSTDFVTSVIDKYNEICKSLPDIRSDIAVQHKAELIHNAKTIMGNASFEQLFTLVEQSDFLTRRNSDSGFKADFEWIMKPDNLVKILSGAYSENYSKIEKSGVPTAAEYNVSLYD